MRQLGGAAEVGVGAVGPEEGEPVGLAVGVTQLIVGLGDTDGEAGADVGVAGAEVEATSAPTQRANTAEEHGRRMPDPDSG